MSGELSEKICAQLRQVFGEGSSFHRNDKGEIMLKQPTREAFGANAGAAETNLGRDPWAVIRDTESYWRRER